MANAETCRTRLHGAPVARAAEVLLLGGVPLNEPVVQHGPFVMNSEAEIAAAIRDYQAGRMGIIDHAGGA